MGLKVRIYVCVLICLWRSQTILFFSRNVGSYFYFEYGIWICLMRKQYLCLMMRVKERAPILDHLKQGVKRGENIASMGDTGTGMDGGDTERMVISRGIGIEERVIVESREARRRDRERTDRSAGGRRGDIRPETGDLRHRLNRDRYNRESQLDDRHSRNREDRYGVQDGRGEEGMQGSSSLNKFLKANKHMEESRRDVEARKKRKDIKKEMEKLRAAVKKKRKDEGGRSRSRSRERHKRRKSESGEESQEEESEEEAVSGEESEEAETDDGSETDGAGSDATTGSQKSEETPDREESEEGELEEEETIEI